MATSSANENFKKSNHTHGRRKVGRRGPSPAGFWKLQQKKVVFLVSCRKKNFKTYGSPWKKFVKIHQWPLPGKKFKTPMIIQSIASTTDCNYLWSSKVYITRKHSNDLYSTENLTETLLILHNWNNKLHIAS